MSTRSQTPEDRFSRDVAHLVSSPFAFVVVGWMRYRFYIICPSVFLYFMLNKK